MASKIAVKTSARRSAAALTAGVVALEDHCREHGHRMSPMRRAVYRYLLSKQQPQTAYQTLDGVKKLLKKEVAPLSVYRALDFLVAEGWLHRLESLKAYTACKEPDHDHAGVLFLCRDCGGAEELDSPQIESLLTDSASRAGFRAQRTVIEVLGVCRHCHA